MDGGTDGTVPQAPRREGAVVPVRLRDSGMALERVVLERSQISRAPELVRRLFFVARTGGGSFRGDPFAASPPLFLRNYKNDGSLFGHDLPIFPTLPPGPV